MSGVKLSPRAAKAAGDKLGASVAAAKAQLAELETQIQEKQAQLAELETQIAAVTPAEGKENE